MTNKDRERQRLSERECDRERESEREQESERERMLLARQIRNTEPRISLRFLFCQI